MKPFLDAGFIATLLLKAPGREAAWEIVQQFDAPYYITHLHIVLIEHMFLHAKPGPQKQAALRAHADWKRYLDEAVFQVEIFDWLTAANAAIDLNRRSIQHQAKPLHYLLAASAIAVQGTPFLSFDPRTRFVAKLAGLQLLPVTL